MKYLLPVLLLIVSPASWPLERFSHDDWRVVLQACVDDHGLVDYHGLAGDRERFDRYVARIAIEGPESNPSLFPTEDDELAYYINAYNALVFQGVLDRGPEEESVWSGLISGFGFFQWMKVRVDGKTMSLDDLEDEIIRKKYRDPRIHAAINCASISCPRLPREPFTGPELDRQLDAAIREFVMSTNHVRVRNDSVEISRIFDWFEADFLDFEERQGTRNAVILDYINRYRPVEDRIDRDLAVRYIPYDKRINKQLQP